MSKDIENQVIGRAQRMGRKTILNIIYLEYINEKSISDRSLINSIYKNDENEMDEELNKFYKNKQINYVLESIINIDLDNLGSNDIEEKSTPLSGKSTPLTGKSNNDMFPDYSGESIDINLDELIKTLH